MTIRGNAILRTVLRGNACPENCPFVFRGTVRQENIFRKLKSGYCPRTFQMNIICKLNNLKQVILGLEDLKSFVVNTKFSTDVYRACSIIAVCLYNLGRLKITQTIQSWFNCPVLPSVY